jgi:hypothetical protein
VFGFILVTFPGRGTTMNKKRTFVMLLLAALLIAELFGPPAQGVSAKPATEVTISWNQPPPATVCVGDEIPISFAYNTYPPGTIAKGTLNGSTTGTGTLTPNNWKTNNYLSMGFRNGTYKAEKEGVDEITITGSGFNVDASTASTGQFEVLKCNYDITIGASDFVDQDQVKIDSQFSAKGVITIDDSGVVYGTGTDKYKISVTWIPPKTLTCEKPVDSNNNSTFVIFGTATKTNIRIEFRFEVISTDPAYAKCKDAEDKDIYVKLTTGDPVNPNQELGIKVLNFTPKANRIRYAFNYGKGWGIIWVIKRKAK